MKTQNAVLLPETVDGIPRGNYDGSSMTFSEDKFKAVGYYKKSATSMSLRFRSDDFVGQVKIEASLDSDPSNDSDWFDAYTFPGDSTLDGSTAVTTDYSITLQGNFVWVRATVEQFSGGSIGPITLTY